MKNAWQTILILLTGLGVTAFFYVQAVQQVQPEVQVASGALLPDISAQEQYFLTYTGSGTLRSEVHDEKAYLEILFDHYNKGLRLSQLMVKTTDDTGLKTLSDSMARRYLSDLLQIRLWLRDWYGEEKPLPGNAPMPVDIESLPIPIAQHNFLTYMDKHHGWASAMTRVALEKNLRPELVDFSQQLLRIERVEEDAIHHLLERM